MTTSFRVLAAAVLGLLAVGSGAAQVKAKTVDAGAVSVLMLSDVHFDPFRDPTKMARLEKAPVAEWDAILKEPEASAADQAAGAAALAACGGRGLDSDHTLFAAALKAAKTDAAGVKFVTISGDLLVHQFDCRYAAVSKAADKKAGYPEFASKTASYVIERVGAEFPGAPVYVALGNNDSGCGDYKLDVNDKFLAGTSKAVIGGLRGASAEETKQAQADYERDGYFAVTLPAPMEKTRLLAFDDMYESRKYQDCGGKKESKGGEADMSWLRGELDGAAARGEKVWVMGHIPPGIDVYSTLKKGRLNVCGGAPETFLGAVGKDSLGDEMAAHAGVIALGIFGHTHMDEMKWIGTDGKPGVAVKGVASVSPVNGNLPSFTVAEIDAKSAGMTDYVVYRAPNKTGVGAAWVREYGFRETYKVEGYSAAAVKAIADGFHADGGSATPASQAYEKYFDTGQNLVPMAFAWPQYACGIDHYTESGYQTCACGAK